MSLLSKQAIKQIKTNLKTNKNKPQTKKTAHILKYKPKVVPNLCTDTEHNKYSRKEQAYKKTENYF